MRDTADLILIAAGLLATCAFAQSSPDAIQQKLAAEYSLTQPTGDNTDIVTAGAVLTLKKGPVVMVPISTPDLFPNTYKNGKMGQNILVRMPTYGSNTSSNRKFVPGEKIWVTQIAVKDGAVVFNLLSDSLNDVRYKATVKFPFPKGSVPPVDQIDKTVAEVFAVQTTDAGEEAKVQQPATRVGTPPAGRQASQQPAVQPAPEAPPAPIAPPPPPADAVPAEPPTLSKGQTVEQIVAVMGQPQTILKPGGTKQIYVYKNMKVTFVSGKVTDFQ